jgi:hypothetical protein
MSLELIQTHQLLPNQHVRLTRGMMSHATGLARNRQSMEREKQNTYCKVDSSKTISQLENTIKAKPKDFQEFLIHLKQHFEVYDEFHDFYTKRRFIKDKFTRYVLCQRTEMLMEVPILE